MSLTDTAIATWQAEFLGWLRQTESPDASQLGAILDAAQLDAAACLTIYRNSYILRLRECLAQQFPASRYALGADLFNDFADSYLQACPPHSYTLYQLGDRFVNWLTQNRPDRDLPETERESWIDFMLELASYEWRLFQLHDAPGGETLPLADSATPEAHWRLQPSMELQRYRYPVAWYYHQIRAGAKPDFPAPQRIQLALLRQNYRVINYPLNPMHYQFLYSLQQGASINNTLQQLADTSGRSLDELTLSWQNEVRDGWLAAGFFVVGGGCV